MADFGDLRGEPWWAVLIFWAFIALITPFAWIGGLYGRLVRDA